jgi:hypothetical protein
MKRKPKKFVFPAKAVVCGIVWCQAAMGQATQDIGWPRQVSQNGAVLVYYQPQVDEWKDYKELTVNMAFSLAPGGTREMLGVATLKAGTLVDKDAHLVYLKDVQIPDVRFPQLNADSVKLMGQLFRKLMPTAAQPISLDRLTADVEVQQQQTHGVPLNNDPPPILYSAGPAILLLVDGDPVYSPIEKLDLQFIVNTNWDLFQDKKKKDYYLLLNSGWMTAKELKGPWTPTVQLPKDMSKLPSGQNFDDVRKMVPPPAPSGSVPTVYYSNKPAELIVLKGSPVYSTISGTQLLYITNTDNDIFVDNSTKMYYILLSGRWFRSGALGGPWTYAGNNLPKDFARIPANSLKAHVLSSVPGTQEASDAVMLAQVPTTAIVNKAEVEAKAKVTYDGSPEFKPIEKTSMQYATNTQEKVIKYGDLYYLCFQAVWFMSASPNGPWKCADDIPKEIYTIPPSSPVYNVTYVTQTNATPTTVESSTTGGYFGMFVLGLAAGACIAYGTGWYYPPHIWYGPGMMYPVYRPWPCTYGVGAVYNPYTGGWAAGRAAYGPYGAAHSAAWYNPATGRYGRSATVQTPWGGRSAASAYNPWTGGYASTRQGHNAYSQWGSSVASRGNQWVQTGHVSTAGGSAYGYKTSGGKSGVITTGPNGTHGATNNNNVYAGHDGNVYKKNSNGSWSQYNNSNKSWQQPAAATQNTMHGLGSSDQARQRGQTQTQQFQHHGGGRPGGGGGGVRRR